MILRKQTLKKKKKFGKEEMQKTSIVSFSNNVCYPSHKEFVFKFILSRATASIWISLKYCPSENSQSGFFSSELALVDAPARRHKTTITRLGLYYPKYEEFPQYY